MGANRLNRLRPFGWFGGKFLKLDWLLPLLPDDDGTTFVDVFGGSGAVLLNRKPSFVEVFNDIDESLVVFFRVLRDDPDALVRAVSLTPWSRTEHKLACESDGDTDLERARRFFVRCSQSIAGKVGRRPSDWGYAVRETRGPHKSLTSSWKNCPDQLARVARRLLRAQIECSPAVEVIRRFDSPEAVFYCDPPYVHSTRHSTKDYEHEMTDDDHRALAEVLSSIKGRAAVSGYRSPLYDRLYDGWHRTDDRPAVVESSRRAAVPTVRQDCLWTNYDPALGQATLFAS